MTVTKRKVHRNESEVRVVQDTGVKFSCDACSADLSHTVRIRCAQQAPRSPRAKEHPAAAEQTDEEIVVPTCEDFDLCGTCFIQGREVGRHKRWHDYRVVEQHAYPIFDNEWGADEELLLIDACQLYGLGNWADIAEHIGSFRTKEEVEEHYINTYVNGNSFPELHIDPNLDLDQDCFQSRKRARLEIAQERPLVAPMPKPVPSVPSCHEVGGFMPGRLEFEHEYENDAETLVKDMEFGLVYRFGGDSQPARPPDDIGPPSKDGKEPLVSAEREGETETKDPPPQEEDDEELDLKLTILEVYNERYDRRVESKALIFDRALTDYKKITINEKKRGRDERELVNRSKVFARIQTSNDYEHFVDGLLYELTLRRRILELQEYRRAGLTSFAEADKYEKDRTTRLANRQRDFARGPRMSNGQREGGPTSKPFKRQTHYQLTLSGASCFNLLTDQEKQLCSELRILPKPYLFIKQTILRESARRNGQLQRREVRAMFRIDANKVNRIFDSLLKERREAVLVNGRATEVAEEEPIHVNGLERTPSVDHVKVEEQDGMLVD